MAKIEFYRKIGAGSRSELLVQGYSRRTTAAEPRLSEIVAEYRQIGFEVQVLEHHVEPGACGICFEYDAEDEGKQHFDVYVRPGPSMKGGR